MQTKMKVEVHCFVFGCAASSGNLSYIPILDFIFVFDLCFATASACVIVSLALFVSVSIWAVANATQARRWQSFQFESQARKEAHARQSSGPFWFSFAEVIFAFLLDRVSCGAFNSKAKRVKTHMLANRLGRFRFPSRR